MIMQNTHDPISFQQNSSPKFNQELENPHVQDFRKPDPVPRRSAILQPSLTENGLFSPRQSQEGEGEANDQFPIIEVKTEIVPATPRRRIPTTTSPSTTVVLSNQPSRLITPEKNVSKQILIYYRDTLSSAQT